VWLRWRLLKKSHLAPLVKTKTPCSVLDNGTASRSYAVVQFDGDHSHVSDPRAGFKHFYFGAFDVHFQQIN